MSEKIFPAKWLIDPKWEAKDHLMNLKGKDYLNVQNRLLWFIRDQRQLIAAGLATTSYVVKTSVVEHDRQAGYAHFKTYVRDVLGNVATMYGSEEKKDFPDYAEKASTKSLGRALLCLGYGTGMAPEMDESDERPVDSPVERKPASAFVAQPPAIKPAAKHIDDGDEESVMTLATFITEIRKLRLDAKDAMKMLGVRSLDGVDLAQGLRAIQASLAVPSSSH